VVNRLTAALSKLPWYGQIGLFVVVSLALAAGFYYQIETPQQTAMAARTQELTAIQARITHGQQMARRLPEFRKQIGELEARMEQLKPILPSDRDAGDLLRRVQTLAVQSNLTVLGFRPQAITVNEIHAEWPINLQLEGNYHNLGLFLDKVSKFPRIITISNLNLSAKSPPDPAASMTIGATATTFVLAEAVLPPAPKGPAQKGPATKP
jgi:type IV pilus assembly protein PilO